MPDIRYCMNGIVCFASSLTHSPSLGAYTAFLNLTSDERFYSASLTVLIFSLLRGCVPWWRLSWHSGEDGESFKTKNIRRNSDQHAGRFRQRKQ